MEPTLESRFSKAGSPMTAIWAERAAFSSFKFRDSKCLNQAMDSRFRGNDVISARHVTFTLAVIPAKAGIHFGQRTPKFEFVKSTAGPEFGMGGFAESVGAVREIASELGPVARNRARPIKRRGGPGPVHRDWYRASTKSGRGRAEGGARRPGTGSVGMQLPGPAPGIDPRARNCPRSFGYNRKSRSPSDAGKDGDHRPSWRSCAGRRIYGSLPYVIMIRSGRRTTMEGMSRCINTKAT